MYFENVATKVRERRSINYNFFTLHCISITSLLRFYSDATKFYFDNDAIENGMQRSQHMLGR